MFSKRISWLRPDSAIASSGILVHAPSMAADGSIFHTTHDKAHRHPQRKAPKTPPLLGPCCRSAHPPSPQPPPGPWKHSALLHIFPAPDSPLLSSGRPCPSPLFVVCRISASAQLPAAFPPPGPPGLGLPAAARAAPGPSARTSPDFPCRPPPATHIMRTDPPCMHTKRPQTL